MNKILNHLPYADVVKSDNLPNAYTRIGLGAPYRSCGNPKNDDLLVQVFREHPEKLTLAVLYDKETQEIRSVYGSNGVMNDKDNDEPFTHILGDKLRKAELDLSCTVSAYSHLDVFIPEGLSTPETKAFLKKEVRHAVNNTDQVFFEPEWESAKELCMNDLLNIESPNLDSTSLVSGPVDFAVSAVGYEVKALVDALCRSTDIAPEIFMYLSTKSVVDAGCDLEDALMTELKEKAITASNALIEKHIKQGQPIMKDLMLIRDDADHTEQVTVKAGTVLAGTVENLECIAVFTKRITGD